MPRYYEFDVVLEDIEPRIWRRLLVRTTSSFADLHKAIQESFGWTNSHLWEFRTPTLDGRPIAGVPRDEDLDRPVRDGRGVKLSEYFSSGWVAPWCEYVYDFGDDWVHEVKFIRLVSDKAAFKRRLLDGARACPPEDSGGVPGYERLLHFLRTGEDLSGDPPEDLRTWLGDWKPDAFDLAAAKAAFDR